MITKVAHHYLEKEAFIGKLVGMGLNAMGVLSGTKANLKKYKAGYNVWKTSKKVAPYHSAAKFSVGLGAGSYLGNNMYQSKKFNSGLASASKNNKKQTSGQKQQQSFPTKSMLKA